jgi:cell wall-associated NlpC family hydrolase
MKYAILICLSVIILIISAFRGSREDEGVADWDQTVIRNTLINADQVGDSLRDSIVSFGMKLLGTPYVVGACSKDGFDCSGFVYFVFRHFKILVPRSSSQYRNFGKEIPIDSIRKGDILLFLSPTRNVVGHVGIVTNPKGKDSDFIHASSGSEMKVIITSLKKERYKRRFVKALNVL